ncbi:ABC transporter permease [Marinactinospora thermotolerans]|uniref:Monosaccharide ABC transporter membrane protein, CUT2 family n=1 Tax=Marinactinospora thermotolerans DSM 45154 TaxID=1122192 RepID=A0A1T4M0A4_9ACTN|nr:ABC transporter permease [Marinactinospora thermotolerans]SJZ60419.1 monosaccharide ABC transporter membrane protein, CUT2 family [Marinactinospora thermotolerans DSM 45154]
MSAPAPTAAPPPATRRVSRALLATRMPSAATAALLVVAVTASALMQHNFFTPYGLTSNFATILPVATIAVAQTIVVLAGGIDLSIGTIVTLSSVVAVQLMDGDPGRVPLALAAGLATGAACGLLNGLVVAVLRLQPIVATFASSYVFGGLALLVLPTPGGTVPAEITGGYRQVIALLLPVPAVLLLVLWLAWRLLRAHRIGQYLYAVGGNAGASYASAVPVARVRVFSYTAGGTVAALAGIALLANSGSGDPFIGNELTLGSIAALVIGGTRLSGGAGGAGGAILGAIVLTLIQNLVFFAGVPTNARELVNGAIIIVAIALAGLLTARGGTSDGGRGRS